MKVICTWNTSLGYHFRGQGGAKYIVYSIQGNEYFVWEGEHYAFVKPWIHEKLLKEKQMKTTTIIDTGEVRVTKTEKHYLLGVKVGETWEEMGIPTESFASVFNVLEIACRREGKELAHEKTLENLRERARNSYEKCDKLSRDVDHWKNIVRGLNMLCDKLNSDVDFFQARYDHLKRRHKQGPTSEEMTPAQEENHEN